jgi:hypothetical protein
MASRVPRGLVGWLALVLLRHDARLRAGVSALLPVVSFLAGRISVNLPRWANAALITASILSVPVIYTYSLPAEQLRFIVARKLLKRMGPSLAVVARSKRRDDLPEYLEKHCPEWIAPGVIETVREQAANQHVIGVPPQKRI